MIMTRHGPGQRTFPPRLHALEDRMARTQGSRADVTGPLIRTHARRLFARQGYAAVSMRQIASAVGVQAGALYAYTPDKQALLFDLLESHMQELLGAWSDIPGDPLARLEHFVRFHIDTSLDHADAVFLSYMELRNLSRSARHPARSRAGSCRSGGGRRASRCRSTSPSRRRPGPR